MSIKQIASFSAVLIIAVVLGLLWSRFGHGSAPTASGAASPAGAKADAKAGAEVEAKLTLSVDRASVSVSPSIREVEVAGLRSRRMPLIDRVTVGDEVLQDYWHFDAESGILSVDHGQALADLTLHAEGYHSLSITELDASGLVVSEGGEAISVSLVPLSAVPVRVVDPSGEVLDSAAVGLVGLGAMETLEGYTTNDRGFAAIEYRKGFDVFAIGNSRGLTSRHRFRDFVEPDRVYSITAAFTQVIELDACREATSPLDLAHQARVPIGAGSGVMLLDYSERLMYAPQVLQEEICRELGIPYSYGLNRKVIVAYDRSGFGLADDGSFTVEASCDFAGQLKAEVDLAISSAVHNVYSQDFAQCQEAQSVGSLRLVWGAPDGITFPTGLSTDYVVHLRSQGGTHILQYLVRLDDSGAELLGGVPGGAYEVFYRPATVPGSSLPAGDGLASVVPGGLTEYSCSSSGLGWWKIVIPGGGESENRYIRTSFRAGNDPDPSLSLHNGSTRILQSELPKEIQVPLQAGRYYFLDFPGSPFFEPSGLVPLSGEALQSVPFESGYLLEGAQVSTKLEAF